MVAASGEDLKEVRLRVKIELPYDLVAHYWLYHLRRPESKRHRPTILQCSTIHPSHDLEQPKCPSTHECTKNK